MKVGDEKKENICSTSSTSAGIRDSFFGLYVADEDRFFSFMILSELVEMCSLPSLFVRCVLSFLSLSFFFVRSVSLVIICPVSFSYYLFFFLALIFSCIQVSHNLFLAPLFLITLANVCGLLQCFYNNIYIICIS